MNLVLSEMHLQSHSWRLYGLQMHFPLLSDSCGGSLQELLCQRIPAPTEEKWCKQVASPDQFPILFHVPGLIQRGENHCTLSLQGRGVCVVCFDKANPIL